MSDKVLRWVVSCVVCVLILTAGCAQPKLALKFTPDDSTTYKLATESQQILKFEGALVDEPDIKGKGGSQVNKVEMIFTQNIESVDGSGNAVAKITIKELSFFAKSRDKTTIDFDSTREKDEKNALAKLIGQSYTINITPDGKVTEVTVSEQTRSAVRGRDSSAKLAAKILGSDAIIKRHEVSVLPDAENNQLQTGDTWTQPKTFSFPVVGKKSYDKIYTLKEIDAAGGQNVAFVKMETIPSSETEAEEAIGPLSEMLDNIETYTGKLTFDLTDGKVVNWLEKLDSEWVIIDPTPQPEGKDPGVIRMRAIRLHSLKKID